MNETLISEHIPSDQVTLLDYELFETNSTGRLGGVPLVDVKQVVSINDLVNSKLDILQEAPWVAVNPLK